MVVVVVIVVVAVVIVVVVVVIVVVVVVVFAVWTCVSLFACVCTYMMYENLDVHTTEPTDRVRE